MELSDIRTPILGVAGKLAVADRCPDPRALLESADKGGQSLTGKLAPRHPEGYNRLLNGLGLALDFYQDIHPGVRLEPDCRGAQFVLRDVAIDFHADYEADFIEDQLDRREVIDECRDLFPDLVRALGFGTTLPVEVRLRRSTALVASDA